MTEVSKKQIKDEAETSSSLCGAFVNIADHVFASLA